MTKAIDPKDFREMTAETIGLDLLKALLDEIRLMPDVWQKLTKRKQDDIIERLRSRVGVNVKMAVHTLAAAGRTVVAGDLDQITIKDGVKAVVKFSQAAPNMHELYEASGKAVLIVVASADNHTAGMDDVEGEEDQRAFDMGHEYHDNDGGGMPEGSPVEGEVVDAEIVEPLALDAPPEEETETAE